jgi:hypothetical protein
MPLSIFFQLVFVQDSVIIKDLIRIIQYRIDDSDLPTRILDVGSSVGAHKRRTIYDGKVRGIHSV